MSEVIESKILRHRIENIGSLPTVPDTLRKLSRIMEKPNVSLTEVASFVQSDPALTFRILKMVNSAVYGFPGRIASVSHAIMLLGLNVVKGLLLGVSVFELMQKAMTGLYEHSMGCAAAARTIAQKKGLREPEEAYVAGLIHDIGKVVMALEFTKAYEGALAFEKRSISQSCRRKKNSSPTTTRRSAASFRRSGVSRRNLPRRFFTTTSRGWPCFSLSKPPSCTSQTS